jgi:5-methylthioadenosine/S-adenosylhomocysteine deaminase
MNLLVEGGYIVTIDGSRRVIRDGAVVIEDDRIVDVGKAGDLKNKYPRYEILNAKKKIILPGLIDAHLHQTQMLARGLADDVDLITWIHERILPYEAVMDDHDAYLSALLCSMEAIKTGTTYAVDPGGYRMENVAKAMSEIGIRGLIAWASMDVDDPARPIPKELKTSTEEAVKRNEELLKRCQGMGDGRITVWCGLRVEPNVSAELMRKINDLAVKHGVGVEMHNAVSKEQMEWVLKRTGKTTVEYLDSLGVLGPHWLLIHMGWITDKEVSLLKQKDVKIAHVPGASMKGAYGSIAFGKFPELLSNGVTVCLGCDSCAANNSLDMFRAMYLAATAHKEVRYDPDLVLPEEALEMATIQGAKAIGQASMVGSIEKGKKADLIIINPNSSNWVPNHEFALIPNIVYSGEGRDVETVIIDGKIVMENRKIKTIDEVKVLEESQKSSERILDRLAAKFGLKLEPRWLFI